MLGLREFVDMAKRFTSAPEQWAGEVSDHIRYVAQTVNGLLSGKSNNSDTVTLSADATSTVVSNPNVTANTVVSLTPTSSSAAAALSGVWVETSTGKVTINHASDSESDRTYGISYVG